MKLSELVARWGRRPDVFWEGARLGYRLGAEHARTQTTDLLRRAIDFGDVDVAKVMLTAIDDIGPAELPAWFRAQGVA